VIGDLDVPIRWDDVDDARFEPLVLADGADGQARAPGEDLLQVTHARWFEVLRDDDGRGEVVRQRRDQPRERVNPAR
jgi:hypothetical protein